MRFCQARVLRGPLAIVATTLMLAACDEESPTATNPDPTLDAQFAQLPQKELDLIVQQIRRVTDRYHDIDRAYADGFVFVHGCEIRPGEAPAGLELAHPGRMGDGKLRAGLPDGLLYEPSSTGKPKLLGVEMIVPYAMWTQSTPPRFLGQTLQAEDEFAVFGLHIWTWRDNPDGLFAEGNPNVDCDA